MRSSPHAGQQLAPLVRDRVGQALPLAREGDWSLDRQPEESAPPGGSMDNHPAEWPALLRLTVQRSANPPVSVWASVHRSRAQSGTPRPGAALPPIPSMGEPVLPPLDMKGTLTQ
jgi:hypothetical protein